MLHLIVSKYFYVLVLLMFSFIVVLSSPLCIRNNLLSVISPLVSLYRVICKTPTTLQDCITIIINNNFCSMTFYKT